MIRPNALKKEDKVAIVSLSSGMLGEAFCSHYIELGQKRLAEFGLKAVFMPNALRGLKYLAEHPEARAEDLKSAFYDDSVKGIICAIGGDDTYRLAPYLLNDEAFKRIVQQNPKIFTGFSDTTINHLMFYKLGLQTYYGPNYINDLSEMDRFMLPYTKEAIEHYYFAKGNPSITSSPVWYEERTEFGTDQMGISRIGHPERHRFELLQGAKQFSGKLLGGCLESLYDLIIGERYPEEAEINKKYQIFPSIDEWRDKILFIETSEVRPAPEKVKEMISVFKNMGVIDVLSGILVGKPQNEAHYSEYKIAIIEAVARPDLPILYNINFGHAYPRTVLAYGAKVKVDADLGEIHYLEKVTEESM